MPIIYHAPDVSFGIPKQVRDGTLVVFLTFAPMTVYNETIIVEEASYPNWMAYIRQVHIPAVMATGYFDSYKILNVIDSPNDGVTTCVQYNTDSEERFAKFYNEHLQGLHKSHHELYENRYVLYSSLMETIAES